MEMRCSFGFDWRFLLLMGVMTESILLTEGDVEIIINLFLNDADTLKSMQGLQQISGGNRLKSGEFLGSWFFGCMGLAFHGWEWWINEDE